MDEYVYIIFLRTQCFQCTSDNKKKEEHSIHICSFDTETKSFVSLEDYPPEKRLQAFQDIQKRQQQGKIISKPCPSNKSTEKPVGNKIQYSESNPVSR